MLGICSTCTTASGLAVIALTGGQDEVTAATNLWQHKRITNKIRDAAVRMTGTDAYKKVRPPGDTRLFM